jgi:hypothetical protein
MEDDRPAPEEREARRGASQWMRAMPHVNNIFQASRRGTARRSGGKHHCHGNPESAVRRSRLTPKGADRDTIPQVQVFDPNRESAPEVGAENRPVSLPRRLAALFVLIALLASAAISSWWIISNQADFFAADGQRAPATADEAHP